MTDKKLTSITAEQVADFLQQQPEFFEGKETLLSNLKISHGGGAVSLMEKQVAVMRERNVELRQRLNQLLEVAGENDKLFEKTRKLLLSLLVAENASDIYGAIYTSLKADFGSDCMALILTNDAASESEKYNYVRKYSAENVNPSLARLINGNKAVCGVLRGDELAALFPGEEERVGSAAMVPLHWQGQWGLLAIGSLDPEHFKSSLGTLFINHIGEVLSRALSMVATTRCAGNETTQPQAS